MRRGQLARLVRGRKTGAILPTPELVTPPQLVSQETGVARVGVLISIAPGAYTPEPATRRYEIKANGVLVSETAFYVPTADVEGQTLQGFEIVGNASGQTTAQTATLGPVQAGEDPGDPPDPGAAYAGVDPATLAKRAEIVALFEGRWEKHTNQAFHTDLTVTSMAALDAAWDALEVSDLSRWHRIRLDSSVAAANWTSSITLGGSVESQNPQIVTGHLYGGDRDRASSGGGVVIESTDPDNPVLLGGTLTLRGVRGVHLRNLRPAVIGAASIIVTKHSLGGTSGTRYPEAPIVCIEDCELGAGWNPAATDLEAAASIAVHVTGHAEQLDVYNNRLRGNANGFQVSEGTFIRVFGNDFQVQFSDVASVYAKSRSSTVNSSFADRTVVWRKGNTGRNWGNLPFAAAEHCDWGQNGSSTNVQDTLVLHEEEVVQQGRPQAVRDALRFLPGVNPADGDTVTVDGVTFTWRDAPSLATDIQRHTSQRSTSCSNAKTKILAYGLDNLRDGLSTSSYFELHFDKGELPASSMSLGTISDLRLSGGMQGWQEGDAAATYRLDGVCINCLVTAIQNGATLYTGDWTFDRCTLARVNELAPAATLELDGFTSSGEGDVSIKSNKAAGTLIATTHTIRNSVLSYVQDLILGGGTVYDADGTYVRGNATVILDNCRYVRWDASAPSQDRADTLLSGPITTDAGGRLTYAVQNDGLNSQQAFREEMYAVLKLADADDRAAIGVVDPADWSVAA